MTDDEGNAPEIKDVLADIDLKADQLRSVIFSHSLLDIMTALSERHGYQAVKAATEALRPPGRAPTQVGKGSVVWVSVELIRLNQKINYTDAFKYLKDCGGLPYPAIKEGEYDRRTIQTEANIRKWYYEAVYDFSRKPEQIASAFALMMELQRSFKLSGKPFRQWLRNWLSALYVTPPNQWGEIVTKGSGLK